MEWDVIIVGAGSAGCAVAYPLVKAGQRVLLLEAGGSDRSACIRIPAAVWRIRPQHDWGYRSNPDPTRNGATEEWHRGRVLGGTSSINGMLYVRGAPGDFDRWARDLGGAGGWSARELEPLFREIEHSDLPGPARGHDGRLYLRTVRRPHRITDAFIASVHAAGHPINPDYNGADQEGVGYLQMTQRRGLRWSSADAFLRPLLHARNFQLATRALVEKIEMESAVAGARTPLQARAVVFRHKGALRRETARRIVLSAGTLNSPKLLMLSGLGDAQELRRHRVPVALDLRGVGCGLREHALVQLTFRTRVPTYNLTQGPLQKLAIAVKYLRYGEGPIGAAYEAIAFLKTLPQLEIPDMQVFFAPIGWGAEQGHAKLMSHPAIKVVILRSHTVSRGRIGLVSADPAVPPAIEPRLLESDADVDALVRGIRLVRRILRTAPIADLIAEEVTPGAGADDDASLRAFVRQYTEPACHPMGTCRMGVDEDAVVGPDLRVHGVANLWVADASIMPDAISANLNAPSILIGAKLGRQLAVQPPR